MLNIFFTWIYGHMVHPVALKCFLMHESSVYIASVAMSIAIKTRNGNVHEIIKYISYKV